MSIMIVDEKWTKEQLRTECKRRGVYRGCSQKDKAGLIRQLNGSTTGQVVVVPPCTQTAEQATVAELRTECKRRGLRNYSRLKKNELVRLLEGSTTGQDAVVPPCNQTAEQPTVAKLRAECKRKGLRNYSRLRKNELVGLLQGSTTGQDAVVPPCNQTAEQPTVAKLRAECKRKGLRNYSRLRKNELVGLLQGSTTGQAAVVPPCNQTAEQPTVAKLRAECKRKGLRNYSRLRKNELVGLLEESNYTKLGEERLEDLTLEELRDKCRCREMKGYSKLEKEDLIRRIKDCALEREEQGQQDSRRVNGEKTRPGPLNRRAQERFDAGPAPLDMRGHLYIYYEADGAFTGSASRTGSNGGGGHSGVREWKIGKTTRDRPERRMQQSAGRNGKIYKLRASWEVPWCGYVEKVVHLDLGDLRVVPGKEKVNGKREDGGTEWFRADYELIEARVLLALRMVRVRAADEGIPMNNL